MYEDMLTQAEPGCDVGGLRSDTSRLPRIGVTRLMGPHNCPITARMKEVCENARPGGAVPSQSSVTRYQTGGGQEPIEQRVLVLLHSDLDLEMAGSALSWSAVL